MENRKIRLAEEGLQYRKGFKWKTVAYADIARVYMRVEAVKRKCAVERPILTRTF